ncbi:isoleucine--tRNA ligase, cytoplasmic-like [Haematobia irritans]|uniref:isoleucine--tRNA ligase, cytoplasmic-like n=1 Tax=Haematobia irritans TaxID=7368 RepID=UPI003F502DF8
MTPNEEFMEEGTAREVINRIQKFMKKAQLIPPDPVLIYYELNATDKKKAEMEQMQKVMNNYTATQNATFISKQKTTYTSR